MLSTFFEIFEGELIKELSEHVDEKIVTKAIERALSNAMGTRSEPKTQTREPQPQLTEEIEGLGSRSDIVAFLKRAKEEKKFFCVDTVKNINRTKTAEKTYYFYPKIYLAGKPDSEVLCQVLTMFKKTDLKPDNVIVTKKTTKTATRDKKTKVWLPQAELEEPKEQPATPQQKVEQPAALQQKVEEPKEDPATPQQPKEEQPREPQLVKNKFGNLEESTTSMVFDENGSVIGLQQSDGAIVSLTALEVAICEQNGWKYGDIGGENDEQNIAEKFEEAITLISNEK